MNVTNGESWKNGLDVFLFPLFRLIGIGIWKAIQGSCPESTITEEMKRSFRREKRLFFFFPSFNKIAMGYEGNFFIRADPVFTAEQSAENGSFITAKLNAIRGDNTSRRTDSREEQFLRSGEV